MREGPFEITVLDDQDAPLLTEYVENAWFVAANPGKSYHVRINVYRDASGKFPAEHLRLGLFVDGADVNYWKRLDLSDERNLPKDFSLPISSIFWGFKKNTSEIRSFVFSKPQVSHSLSSSSALNAPEFGTIKLVVYEARLVEGIFHNNCSIHEIPTNLSIANKEDQKFWKQPSLVTASGRKVESDKEKFIPLMRWENTSSIPLATMVLRYHTQETLNFLRNSKTCGKRDREEGEEDTDCVRKERRNSSHDQEANVGGDVVEIVREKEVPLMDLTEENPQWEIVKMKKTN